MKIEPIRIIKDTLLLIIVIWMVLPIAVLDFIIIKTRKELK
jgi:hypothetical protein